MVTEDHLGSINESDIPRIRPEARRNEYANLLSLSPGLLVAVNQGSARFIFSASRGLAIGPGWGKGIQFIPNGARIIGILMESLDEAPELPAQEQKSAQRRLLIALIE